MRTHAPKCPCVTCFDVKVQRASRWLTRVAVVLFAVIAALLFNLIAQVDALPPVPLSAQQSEDQ